jgi:GNAT superfamily N-acetyltransferase
VHIIRAKPSEAATLSAIAWAAKAFWGYPSHWMEQWREQLTIAPNFIAENETFAAIINRQTVAFHALLQTADVLRLEHLWVLPNWMGQGIGRTLFRHAAERAAARGVLSLTIEADPHAEPFYQHMGATRVGTTTSEIDGCRRELPLLILDLAVYAPHLPNKKRRRP